MGNRVMLIMLCDDLIVLFPFTHHEIVVTVKFSLLPAHVIEWPQSVYCPFQLLEGQYANAVSCVMCANVFAA